MPRGAQELLGASEFGQEQGVIRSDTHAFPRMHQTVHIWVHVAGLADAYAQALRRPLNAGVFAIGVHAAIQRTHGFRGPYAARAASYWQRRSCRPAPGFIAGAGPPDLPLASRRLRLDAVGLAPSRKL